MILEEKHKEFAVKSFAKFMIRSQVVDAFVQEFTNDLPKPPPFTYMNQQNGDNQTIDDQLNKDRYINDRFEEYHIKYHHIYASDAKEKFEQDSAEILQHIEKEYAEKCENIRNNTLQQQADKHQEVVNQHNISIKRGISNQLRVYNIIHPKFPGKYKDLFNQTRREHLNNLLLNETDNHEDIDIELQTLYAYVKQRIFDIEDLTDITRNLDLAHRILMTISKRNQNT